MADQRVLKDCQKKFDELKASCAVMHAEIKAGDKQAGKALRTFNNLMRDLTARIQELKNEGHDYPTLKSYLGDKEIRQLHMVAEAQIKEMDGASGLSPGSQRKLDAAMKDYKLLKLAIAAAIKEEKGRATKHADGSKIDKGPKILPELDKLQRDVDKFDREKEGLRGLANTDGDHDSVDLDDFKKGLPKAIARIKAAPNKDGKGFKDAGWDGDKITGRVKQMQKYELFITQTCMKIKANRQQDKELQAKLIADGKKALALADKLAQQHQKLLGDKELVRKLLDDPANATMHKNVKLIVGINTKIKAKFEEVSGAAATALAAAEKAQKEAAKQARTG